MLTRNIDFRNFKIRKNYKNSYNRKLVNKYNKGINYRVIGMGGSTLGAQTIYDFLEKKIKKNFSFVDNLKSISGSPRFRKDANT